MEKLWKEYATFKILKNGTNKNNEDVHKISYEVIEEKVYFPAIYRIQIKDIIIPRCLNNDSNGILAIGQTTNLNERYDDIITSLEKWNGHSEAILAHYIYTYSDQFWQKYIDKKVISVCYYKSDNLDQDETREIIRYIKDFGEPPPFNSAIPGRYTDNIWNEVFG
jgi:hypothetical protein